MDAELQIADQKYSIYTRILHATKAQDERRSDGVRLSR